MGARGEVALFRAFIKSFNALGPEALAKEYHGNRYQVTFQQARGAGRSTPRCELCDVLIIHYPAGNPSAARLTFNQAKAASKPLGCLGLASLHQPYSFGANLEQWDLLSNRPLVRPATKTFQPPSDLLSGALLPSVGSFGVFYPASAGFEFAYFVADRLNPLRNGPSRSGTLQWTHPLHQLRKVAGYTEVLGTCCIRKFGEALELGHVGTPVLHLLSRSAELRAWLAGALVALGREHRESQLPQELLTGLELGRSVEDGTSRRGEEPAPVRAVILVRTESSRHGEKANKGMERTA
ncbi:hypothetical protein FPZ22_08130 [Luteimonas granuli]|uniref:Uncharacterized protein n=1 Tax=Luteimonas granuli TaxID=1176533 RepID=A0A518N7L5_9GAMM|nr:hypothetical protein FPZ22_08130 [Luteimonas granuli]